MIRLLRKKILGYLSFLTALAKRVLEASLNFFSILPLPPIVQATYFKGVISKLSEWCVWGGGFANRLQNECVIFSFSFD